jgi:hypothetical protein
MNLLAQPPLRVNAEAIANDQHPDHQLGIDRRPPDVAIVGPYVHANLGQVDAPVDLSRQMIVGNVPLKAEAVEQRLLITRRSPIISRVSRAQGKGITNRHPNQAEFFNTIRRFQPSGSHERSPIAQEGRDVPYVLRADARLLPTGKQSTLEGNRRANLAEAGHWEGIFS